MLTVSSGPMQGQDTRYIIPVICGVYCITHIETGKRYVGQSVDCIRRMMNHEQSKSLIGTAIRKYGREAFVFEILTETTADTLLIFETAWIKLLNTMEPNGFNAKIGAGSEARRLTRTQRESTLLRARLSRLSDRQGVFA